MLDSTGRYSACLGPSPAIDVRDHCSITPLLAHRDGLLGADGSAEGEVDRAGEHVGEQRARIGNHLDFDLVDPGSSEHVVCDSVEEASPSNWPLPGMVPPLGLMSSQKDGSSPSMATVMRFGVDVEANGREEEAAPEGPATDGAQLVVRTARIKPTTGRFLPARMAPLPTV